MCTRWNRIIRTLSWWPRRRIHVDKINHPTLRHHKHLLYLASLLRTLHRRRLLPRHRQSTFIGRRLRRLLYIVNRRLLHSPIPPSPNLFTNSPNKPLYQLKLPLYQLTNTSLPIPKTLLHYLTTPLYEISSSLGRTSPRRSPLHLIILIATAVSDTHIYTPHHQTQSNG